MHMKILSAGAALAALVAAAGWAQSQPSSDRAAPQAAPMTHLGVGTIRRVDQDQRIVTIDHQAIRSLNMPAMTMQFRLADTAIPPPTVGQAVAFTFSQVPEGLLITALQPIAGAAQSGGDGHAMPDMKDPGGAAMPGMGAMDMRQMMDRCHEKMQRDRR